MRPTGFLVVGIGCGAVGTALLALGLVVDPKQAFFSYLVAHTYVLTIVLGALVFLMAVHAMNAVWPVAVRRLAETIAGSLPAVALLFVPIWFGLDALYPWMHPAAVADSHTRALLEHKRVYLNAPFFVGRSIFYFVCWSAIAGLLRGWSVRQDQGASGASELGGQARVLSSVALPLLGLTMTFASIDWLMSLSPDWYSTMFGLYYFAGGFLAALALLSVMAVLSVRARAILLTDSHYYALGRLLLAFVVFWAYIAFFQLLLMWIADQPIESSYYILRIRGGYRVTSAILVIGHFALPFVLLLSYRLKRNGGLLAAVSSLLLIVHYVDVHWLIAPYGRAGRSPLHWLDLAAALMVIGWTVAFGAWLARGHALVPVGDARLTRALEYHSR